jgi:hypothetical protein
MEDGEARLSGKLGLFWRFLALLGGFWWILAVFGGLRGRGDNFA